MSFFDEPRLIAAAFFYAPETLYFLLFALSEKSELFGAHQFRGGSAFTECLFLTSRA